MRHLEKLWVRALISLLAGGFAQELFHISTGDPNRIRPEGVSPIFLAAVVLTFISVTIFAKAKK